MKRRLKRMPKVILERCMENALLELLFRAVEEEDFESRKVMLEMELLKCLRKEQKR